MLSKKQLERAEARLKEAFPNYWYAVIHEDHWLSDETKEAYDVVVIHVARSKIENSGHPSAQYTVDLNIPVDLQLELFISEYINKYRGSVTQPDMLEAPHETPGS